MDLIATQTYYKVERYVGSIEQKDVEEERTMYLYRTKIATRYREFLIKDVFDISYRMISDDVGFLYLHTSKGVFPYKIKSSPQKFIESFKQQI